MIERISADPIPTDRRATTRLIDGTGKTLMPGLIDAHTHLVMSTLTIAELMTGDPNYIALRAGVAAEKFLMQGFTTARDVGGPTFGLKRAIDEGFVVGPRIYPSGAMISQTSGHGDFRRVHRPAAAPTSTSTSPSATASPPSPTARTRCCGGRASS